MSKSSVNAVVDAVALAALLFLVTTGVLMRYVLPPGSGNFSTLWGMDRHDWGQIHFWIAMALMGVLTLHLFLHWQWIVCMIRGRSHEGSGVRVALAVIGLLALVAIAVAPLLGQVENTGTAPHKMLSGEQPKAPSDQINGSMTLQEVERQTGVRAAVIAKTLGLPPDVPTDERLGRLRKKYSFEIHDIREIVEKHSQPRETEVQK
jgi:hypothetical protein